MFRSVSVQSFHCRVRGRAYGSRKPGPNLSGARTAIIFLDAGGGSQKAIPVVLLLLLVAVISYLKIPPKAFLIRSGAQRNFAHTFVLTFPIDLPSQIFHLFSN